MSVPLIEACGLSKKFCRTLKRSLWYGVKDIAAEVAGRQGDRGALRKGEFWAVKDLSLQLMPGETLGLIGSNGAGKTTLLRILNGLIKPDEGRVTVRGRLQALIALGAGFNPILTGRENIYVNAAILGIGKREVDRRFESIVEFSGIPDFIDTPVQNYSSGMAVRLGFAVAAHLQPDVLLVDEVLAVGDQGFQVKCLNKIGELKNGGTAIILVSHNMHTVSTYSDRVLVKTPGSHETFTDVSAAIMAYKRLVHADTVEELEKHCSGGEGIEFHRVDIASKEIAVGEDFRARLCYRSTAAYENVEIDVGLRVAGEAGWHYQATNVAFAKRVDLAAGQGWLDIAVHGLRTHSARGQVSISIFSHGRKELLFWWRIPVRFTTAARTSGTTLYETTYATGSVAPREGHASPLSVAPWP